MHYMHFLFACFCLCFCLVGCGEEEVPTQQLVTPALTPERICFLNNVADAESSGATICDFQAQTGCQEGEVCAPMWGDGNGFEFERGYCTIPCDDATICPVGRCSGASWGRCPSGLLCDYDGNCREAWKKACDEPDAPRHDNCIFGDNDYCKSL